MFDIVISAVVPGNGNELEYPQGTQKRIHAHTAKPDDIIIGLQESKGKNNKRKSKDRE